MFAGPVGVACSPAEASFPLDDLKPKPFPRGIYDAMDANDDGSIDTSDAVYEFSWLFSFGPLLPPPFPGCGTDPTPDALDCLAFMVCP